ncbi:MAG: hypothetical protein M3Y51_09240 [Actinomycetota bacterium]|nr:hypothetical protein [Actinomycetota bacterium]
MHRTRSWRAAAIGLLAVVTVAAGACAPQAPDGTIATKNWQFRGTQVRVNESQDSIGICWPSSLCQDEPYLLTIGFRVKIGQPGSAQVQVTNDRSNAPENVGEGQTVQVAPGPGGQNVFNGVQALDILDLANTNNKLEVFGTYVWGSEEDQVGNGAAANAVANLLKDALNATLATADLSSLDASFIIDLILDNIGGAFGIIANNIPLLGLGDDVMGGGMYIGIGAQGSLGSALDSVIGSTPFPTINIPLVDVPPDITGGGMYTLTGPKTFTQTFVGGGGSHSWTMQSGPA